MIRWNRTASSGGRLSPLRSQLGHCRHHTIKRLEIRSRESLAHLGLDLLEVR